MRRARRLKNVQVPPGSFPSTPRATGSISEKPEMAMKALTAKWP